MSAKKILVVFGATGKQGGSVITSILDNPKTSEEFKIRGVTRDPSKPTAKAVEAKGVECVAGDISDKESIKHAFHGAYAVFAMTDYWEKMDEKLEFEQGKNIADLAKESGVQHLIWSSLVDVNKLSNGKYPDVYHFDSKARVEEYIKEIGVPATFFLTGFFMSNIPGQMLRQLPPDNTWTLCSPVPEDTLHPLFDAADDTGKFVKAILTHRDKCLGKQIYGATDYYSLIDILNVFKEVYPEAGKNAKIWQLSEEQYKGALATMGMPEKAQVEIYQSMAFKHEFGYFGKASLDESLAILDEKPTTLKDFFSKAKAFEGLN